MAEKFSIIKALDLSKLNKEINDYRFVHREDPYIFINNETRWDIFQDSASETTFEFREYCTISKYCGYKVFIDPTLEYGEIELR